MAKNWIEEFNNDGLLRIDWMIPLMFQNSPSLLRDEFGDMEHICKSDEVLKEYWEAGDDVGGSEYLGEVYFGKIIARVSTPIMEGKSYSWGYMTFRHFIGDSMESIIEQSFKWRDESNKKRKKKVKGK